MLLDFGELVVHVQHAEEREYYALERLWRDCPLVELPEQVHAGAGRAGVTAGRVVVLRHGRTGHNLRRRWQGQLDVPLDEVGVRQSQLAARASRALDPVAVVARTWSVPARPPRPSPTSTGCPSRSTSGCGRSTPGAGRG